LGTTELYRLIGLGCECHYDMVARPFAVCTACSLVGAVHMGVVQGTVTHAVYWLWSVPATVRFRRLVNDHQHANRSHFLRTFRRSIHIVDSNVRHFKTHVRREGTI